MNKFKKMLTKISNHFNAFRKIKCSRPCIKKISYNAEVTFGGAVKFNFNMWFPKRKLDKGIIFLGYGSKVEFGKNVEFRSGCRLFVQKNAKFSISNNSMINTNSFIECREKISIGSNTLISHNVKIMDSDIHKINNQKNSKPIWIGNNVLIGMNCIILKGVSIGDGAVIGAGSIVTKDIPPHTLCAGNPAKVIKNNINWER